jgi:hypothetical protein
VGNYSKANVSESRRIARSSPPVARKKDRGHSASSAKVSTTAPVRQHIPSITVVELKFVNARLPHRHFHQHVVTLPPNVDSHRGLY